MSSRARQNKKIKKMSSRDLRRKKSWLLCWLSSIFFPFTFNNNNNNNKMADWSMLPRDLICEIAVRLRSIEDFIHFSGVCHSWNNNSSMVKSEWIAANPMTPWLLLAECEPDKSNTDECLRKIFSISENKCYELKLPQTFGARFWGSQYGWILMLHLNKEVELFNPITKERLSLPPLQTVPGQLEGAINSCLPENLEHWFQKKFVRRCIVLKMPPKDNNTEDDFVVMMIHGERNYLAFARPGDTAWTKVLTRCKKHYDQVIDVLCWDGLVLILYGDGALAYCDVSRTANCEPVKAEDYLPAPRQRIFDLLYIGGKMYMVKLDGYLHAVSRYLIRDKIDNETLVRRTYNFKVHKLDYKTKLWERIEDLGDYMLFVGNNTAASVHIAMAPNCQRNTIYFTDDDTGLWTPQSTCGHDMGMFNLRSGKIQLFYNGDDTRSKSSPPTWFIPKSNPFSFSHHLLDCNGCSM